MFRPMRRASRAIPEEAAKHLLQQSRRGVLAVNGDNGYPFAIPINYYYDLLPRCKVRPEGGRAETG